MHDLSRWYYMYPYSPTFERKITNFLDCQPLAFYSEILININKLLQSSLKDVAFKEINFEIVKKIFNRKKANIDSAYDVSYQNIHIGKYVYHYLVNPKFIYADYNFGHSIYNILKRLKTLPMHPEENTVLKKNIGPVEYTDRFYQVLAYGLLYTYLPNFLYKQEKILYKESSLESFYDYVVGDNALRSN